jgi:hypothetical protein
LYGDHQIQRERHGRRNSGSVAPVDRANAFEKKPDYSTNGKLRKGL